MTQHWQRQSEPAILFEDFDLFSAVYCARSGETHVFDAFPTEILRQLPAGEAVSETSVVAALAALMGEPEALCRDRVTETLLALNAMGIVEISSP